MPPKATPSWCRRRRTDAGPAPLIAQQSRTGAQHILACARDMGSDCSRRAVHKSGAHGCSRHRQNWQSASRACVTGSEMATVLRLKHLLIFIEKIEAKRQRLRRRDARDHLCGAKTRAGHPCRRRGLGKGGRCPNHGGCSTGPKTLEGRKRIAEATRERWARWRAERDRVGVVDIREI